MRASPATRRRPLQPAVAGSAAIVARSVAAELSKRLGQRLYVDNKPGGAGNTSMGEVARADDQHTLIPG